MWPLSVSVQTMEGQVYSGGVSCGRFGCSFERQAEKDWMPFERSTIVVRTTAPASLDLNPMLVDQSDTEVTLYRRMGGSGEFGSTVAGPVKRPLNQLKMLKLRLRPAAR
ncbi:MAG: hypothetical protein R3C05_08330 [Pirellulaceae bacterium]